MLEYDVAVAYNKDGIQIELNQRAVQRWRLVYGYQAAPGLFGFSDGGHVLVFMRDKKDDVLEFEAGGGGF
jgi:hypothetical protein